MMLLCRHGNKNFFCKKILESAHTPFGVFSVAVKIINNEMKHYHHIALLSILAGCADAQVSPCIISPNGVTAAEGDDHIPWADIGDTRTCAELVDAAMLAQAGTVAC